MKGRNGSISFLPSKRKGGLQKKKKKQEEKNDSEERYPWLDDADKRKYMTDKEILDKYINLKNSCLDKRERKQVMEMLYKYKDVFSLRDKIGTFQT